MAFDALDKEAKNLNPGVIDSRGIPIKLSGKLYSEKAFREFEINLILNEATKAGKIKETLIKSSESYRLKLYLQHLEQLEKKNGGKIRMKIVKFADGSF